MCMFETPFSFLSLVTCCIHYNGPITLFFSHNVQVVLITHRCTTVEISPNFKGLLMQVPLSDLHNIATEAGLLINGRPRRLAISDSKDEG